MQYVSWHWARIGSACLGLVMALAAPAVQAASLTPKESLGRQIFFDTNLSQPKGQACASCHAPSAAFTDPSHAATSRGANLLLAGARNAPTAMYAAFIPPFSRDSLGNAVGGQFLDGRVNSLEQQAQKPFLNPIEMGNPSVEAVVAKLATASYAPALKALYGQSLFANPQAAFNAAADAIAAYERSPELSPFSSKYDAWQAGKAQLTASEARGLALFNSPAKGNCAACHPSVSNKPGGVRALFTDHSYDNLGVPKNPANPVYIQSVSVNPAGLHFVDNGLSATSGEDSGRGKFKVPTLRNIARTGPYMHNGYFTTLQGVVDFYNTRDKRRRCLLPTLPQEAAQALACWPAPEVVDTVNQTELGRLGLNAFEVNDIVNFLGTLTDGWTP